MEWQRMEGNESAEYSILNIRFSRRDSHLMVERLIFILPTVPFSLYNSVSDAEIVFAVLDNVALLIKDTFCGLSRSCLNHSTFNDKS